MQAGSCGRDRLSNLPEPVIYHILSFLDTRSAVQTSVLSRSWRCAWKHVSVLHLCSSPFKQLPIFERYVDKVLSTRYDLKLRKVICSDGGVTEEVEPSLLVRVIEYALLHDTQHLAIDLVHQWDHSEHYCRFFCLFRSNLGGNRLRTLELARVYLDGGFPSFGFRMLTTLKLVGCWLSFDREEDLDPFSNFPCLQILAVRDCSSTAPEELHEMWFKFSGLELLSLSIKDVNLFNIQVLAPKLKSFQYAEYTGSILESIELRLPSLDHADIFASYRLDYFGSLENEEKQRLISLFQGLQNVESLTLHSETVQALSNVSGFLEGQPSPFKRLKHLIVGSNKIHHKVANYFLKGSSSAETIIEFVRICSRCRD